MTSAPMATDSCQTRRSRSPSPMGAEDVAAAAAAGTKPTRLGANAREALSSSGFRAPGPCDIFHKRPKTPNSDRFPMATETTLRPGEIKDILLREIDAADLHELDVEEVGSVLEVKDGI